MTESAGQSRERRMDASRRRIAGVGFDLRRAFDDNGGALLGYAVNALRDRPLAEDCVQETFLRAWRARERFDPREASERTWLFSIARNVIVDALRARARLPLIGDHAELESRAAEAIDPLERLRMLEALSVLTEAHRTAVVAIHLHGRTYQELSDATGVPVATWRTRTFHALRALRAHLEEMEEPDAHSR
jgi:RNA polymerase sigma-70 factor (ECF subfamily)